MIYANMSAIVLFASSLLLGAFFLFVYRQKRQEYLALWSSAWFILSLRSAASPFLHQIGPSRWAVGLDAWLYMCAALAFYGAASRYVSRSGVVRNAAIGAGAAALWAAAYAQSYFAVPLLLAVGLVFFVVAHTFWQESRKHESRADLLIALTFVVWGMLCILNVFVPRIPWLADMDFSLLDLLPEIFAGVLMVMAIYEEERRRVERNMLALSNLNLATSSFAGGEIEKMLAQGLERVLNVARIPAGALCLHYGDRNGPTSMVMSGLEEKFCAAVQAGNLDEYLVRVVARLGGLVVLRELGRDSNWEALEKEDAFRQFRQLLLEQNLRTVVGISLQAKEHVLGVLLLGTPDHRDFTSAELRLLLALGHQIGMAVENSYLVRQTARRSEELHILNEIGRALSSTLEPDALFGSHLHGNPAIARRGELFHRLRTIRRAAKFGLKSKFTDGELRQKFSRPAGNHMVEYVIRTCQPLLIRERFAEEAQRLGFEPLAAAASLCAVPLILYDRPVGVLAVHSREERAFDEGHVELLRVLASEAAIAIENARLFSEEQKKSRQLSLINSISNHAITTLDPVEMLSKIALEIGKELPYDHIGIAVLDYSAKELVVQAEAGLRREALGRRIPLSEGLIGQVARTGEAATVREASASTPRTVLPGSAAALALARGVCRDAAGCAIRRILHATRFSRRGSSACCKRWPICLPARCTIRLTFQKAQEQAITDGLTGVKTHRFLMEALSAEWKRSTRANRPFALVLMDLDRFKFVNDFYGHLEGDVVLQRVGHILEQNCRRSDVVARYGGDEFVILMPETTVEQARQLASKLRGWVASDPLLRDKNITASFGIAGFPVHGSTPQELIQVADSSMYLSKHQGGNSVSSAEQGDPLDRKRWKKDVLEAYLGVTLKRLFSTGPEAFEEIYRRLEQFSRSLEQGVGGLEDEVVPPAVVETVTSLALAIDAKDQYTQGHSQKVSAYAGMLAQALGLHHRRSRGDSSRGAAARRRKSRHSGTDPQQGRPARSERMGNDEDAHRPRREDSGAPARHGARPGDGPASS